MLLVILLVLLALAAGVLLYMWLEAGWVRYRIVPIEIAGLPDDLDGVRIAHLSDFHLGQPSRGRLASERAVAWVEQRQPDLTCVTGDLLSHPRGEPLLRSLLQRLERPFVVLGNHDVALTRDPFSRMVELSDLDDATLLRDEAVTVTLRGRRVSIAGVEPHRYQRSTREESGRAAASLADPSADLRLLLCHFPSVARQLPPGTFDLILAGHLHGGQITVPHPRGRLALSHPRAKEVDGVFVHPGGTLHISRGLGTSLVPLRLFARPEVTELVLHPSPGGAVAPPGAVAAATL